MDRFIQQIERYYKIGEECKAEFIKILRPKSIPKNNYLLRIGDVPTGYAFVLKGLFSYDYVADNGDVIVKKFFAEDSLIASTAALIQKKPSLFSICAMEDSEVLTYRDEDYRRLMHKYNELAFCHINYLEKNWVADKENLEISLKYDTVKERYFKFLKEYEKIESRLKQRQIASFLGITPTQLSRIRKEL